VKPVDTPHPSDERLVIRYFEAAERDQPLELHLVRCPACEERANRLAAALDSDHDRTLGAADGWFGTDRLARQRDAILARISAARAADGVACPQSRPTWASAPSRVISSRWAAAAVLVVSVGLGSGGWFASTMPSGPDRFSDAPLQAALAPVHEGEDALLLEIDRALARPQTRELRALEALTPRADEAVEF
jgi:hypothetical protein